MSLNIVETVPLKKDLGPSFLMKSVMQPIKEVYCLGIYSNYIQNTILNNSEGPVTKLYMNPE